MEIKNSRRQHDVVQAQLTWVQYKARPAFLCTAVDQRKLALLHLAVDLTGRSTNPLYPDVIYRTFSVRFIQKRQHVQHWFFHRDYEDLFNLFMCQIKAKYSCTAIGGMLGYLQPQGPPFNRHNYKYTTTSGTIQWYVNQKLAFGEGIADWSLMSDSDIQEKRHYLERCLPASLKLELKIWKQTCEFQ